MALSKLVGTGEDLSMELNEDLFCGVYPKLYNRGDNIFRCSNPSDSCSFKRRMFFSLCNSYRDVMFCEKQPFYLKSKADDSCFMDAYVMHALNHIHKTRELVISNDAKLSEHKNSKSKEVIQDGSYLDQGFTRPKVLFLLRLASTAFRVAKRLVQLTPLSSIGNVAHMDRFNAEFGMRKVEEDDENFDINMEPHKRAKPDDFENLLGGNNEDFFIMGMKFTQRSIKLYSNFYSSDIIVASPLGLITKIAEAEVEKEKDVDYLSSIEVLVIDHADVITMQNWSHANTVVEHVNRMPSKQHGADVMRVKQ